MAGRDQADVLLVLDGAHADRAGHAHRELELAVGAVAGLGAVHHDRQLRAPGVLELSDEQLAGLGGRPPVHVPPVVAGGVVAQRVEGQVAGGQVTGGLALQVALQSGAERVEPDDLGVHQQLDSDLLDGLPAQQAERVGAHRARRPDRYDGPAVGRYHEKLVVAGAAGQRGQVEGGAGLPDRHLDVHGAQPRPGPVGGREPPRRGRADADPRRVKLDDDVKAWPADDEADRDEQREHAAGGDEKQFRPAEPDAEQPGGDRDEQGRPPGGRDDPPGGSQAAHAVPRGDDPPLPPVRARWLRHHIGRRGADRGWGGRPGHHGQGLADTPERELAGARHVSRDSSAGGPGTAAGRPRPPR